MNYVGHEHLLIASVNIAAESIEILAVLTDAVCVKMQLLTDLFIKSVFYLFIKSAISFKFVLMLDSDCWC